MLYDRDHYKLALGQINVAKHLVQNVSRDYVRMLKYGDTLYRCKQLKRAALGRMCTILKKLAPSLSYLEEVRKHLSRLPSIDPSSRTLLITGFPNVGKSSFMNQVTHADVEVQPYAFTTKSLFVGHMDYKYLRWQVIDSPGVLDKPLEERNTIEMQAITALAHLQACVLYFFDASEQCGWTLEQQMSLFHSLRPLFASKPLVIVANKVDVVPLSQLPAEQLRALEKIAEDCRAPLLPMSAVNAVGIAAVKKAACEALLERRVETKARSAAKLASVMSRITVATPAAPRDGVERAPFVPESVLAARADRARAEAEARAKFRATRAAEFQDELDAREAEDEEARAAGAAAVAFRGPSSKDEMWANGGPGVYAVDLRRHYLLHKQEWARDEMPHILDGKNVADFVDPDIERRLVELEREEEELARDHAQRNAEDDELSELDEEEEELAGRIAKARAVARKEALLSNPRNGAKMPRDAVVRRTPREQLEGDLRRKGFSVDERTLPLRMGVKRKREEAGDMEVGEGERTAAHVREERAKRARTRRPADAAAAAAHDRVRHPDDEDAPRRGARLGEVYRDAAQKRAMHERFKRATANFRLSARAGEADHKPAPKLLKHMVVGKRGFSLDRR